MSVEPAGADEDGRFLAIFACAPECIKRIGSDGRLIDMNPAGLRMIDAPSLEAVRGRNILDLIDPAHRRSFREAAAQVFRGRSVRLQFEVVGLAGRRLWMDQSAAPLFDRDEPGKVVEMVAVTRDITAQREAEADLLRAKVAEELARSKTLFLADVGNELKTPLSEIIGYGELLKETAADEGRPEEIADIDRILGAAGRLLSMINQMLAVSLEEARSDDAGAAAFELAELIGDAVAMSRPLLHAAATQVVLDLGAAPAIWTGDRRRLDQCVRSVLSAAAEFAAKGAVTIRALGVFESACSWLEIEIAASGHRIAHHDVQEMMTITAMAASAPSHDVGTSALRLGRDTARLMGGTLKVSAEPGGARFVLRVPARPVTSEPVDVDAA